MDEDANRRKQAERKDWYQRNREARIAYAKAWNKANPEKCRQYYQKKYYGKKKVQVQQVEEEKKLDENPLVTRLLGPPMFMFHGKGETIKFN